MMRSDADHTIRPRPSSPGSDHGAGALSLRRPFAAWNVLPGDDASPLLVGMAGEDHRHRRPVVEERRRLLPGRRDLHGLGRRRRAATSPGSPSGIDYLADLGVTCLWLMPFYPTADRDDGYDITDFYGVDPRLGSHGDFVEVDPHRAATAACG